MEDYGKILDEMIENNNTSFDPLPVDALNVVINEFNARMLAKIASSLERIADVLESK